MFRWNVWASQYQAISVDHRMLIPNHSPQFSVCARSWCSQFKSRQCELAPKEGGMLVLDINAHGIPNGRPAEFYEGLSQAS